MTTGEGRLPEIVQSVTLDGATAFTLVQTTYAWTSRYLVTAGAFNNVPTESYDITITLTDTLWQILALTLDDVNIAATIVDSDDGAVRRINLLTLSDAGRT